MCSFSLSIFPSTKRRGPFNKISYHVIPACNLVKDPLGSADSHSFHPRMWVSYCCCKKLAKTWRLKTTQMHYLILLEVWTSKWVSGSSNQGTGRAMVFLEAVGENLVLCISSLKRLHTFLTCDLEPEITLSDLCSSPYLVFLSDSASPASLLERPYNSVGPTWIIWGNLPSQHP